MECDGTSGRWRDIADGGGTEWSIHRWNCEAGRYVGETLNIPVDSRCRSVRDGVASRLSSDLIASEWDDLAGRVSAAPYVRPGWVAAWWRAFGVGDLEIRTLRRDGRLAAVLPVSRRYGVLRSVTNYHTPHSGLLAEDCGAAAQLWRAVFMERSLH